MMLTPALCSSLKKTLLFCAVLAIFTQSPVYGTLTAVGTTLSRFAPRGQKVPMMQLKLTATDQNETWSSITIENNAPFVKFGNGIQEVAIYRAVGSEAFSETQTKVASQTTFSGAPLSIQLNPGELIPSSNGTAITYYIVYTISTSANLPTSNTDITATTELTLHPLVSGAGGGAEDIPISGSTQTDATITGFQIATPRSIAPAVVLPGQTGIPMLAIAFKPAGESIEGDLVFTITNQFANLSTPNSNDTQKITNFYLINDNSNNGKADGGTVDYTSLQAMINSGGSKIPATVQISEDKTQATLTISNDILSSFALGTAFNFSRFVLVYDIGQDIPITANTQVEARLSSLTAVGSNSILPIQANASTLAALDSAKPFVAGLSYSGVKKISTSGNFGPNAILPILQFSLRAFQTTINVQQISIKNPQNENNTAITLPFNAGTNETQDGVKTVYVYKDTGNGTFDGVGGADTLVGTLSTNGLNQVDRVNIPISTSEGSYFSIPKFVTANNLDSTIDNYPEDNSARIFVVYALANTLGTSRRTVASQLQDAIAEAFISVTQNINIRLSGTKPAVSSPDATVTLTQANVSISTLNIMTPSPSIAVQGRIKFPIMSFTLNSKTKATAAAITIHNSNSTFSNTNQGVSRVWLYEDTAPLGIFNSTDTFVAVSTSLNSAENVTLNNIVLENTDNPFILLYDIGQVTAIDSNLNQPSIKAQIQNVSGRDTAGTSLVFSGQVPYPTNPATVAVTAKGVSVNLLSNSFQASNPFVSFNVSYTLKNNTGAVLNILSIEPRIYLNSINGTDITSQFDFAITGITPTNPTIGTGATATVTYTVQFSRPAQVGTNYLDANVVYKVASSDFETVTGQAILTRYRTQTVPTEVWQSAVSTPFTFSNQTSNTLQAWTLPDYISSMEYQTGDTTLPFYNLTALPEASKLFIYFQNLGTNIDPTSITAKLNNIALTQNDYTFSTSLGKLTLLNVGHQDGTLELILKDINGNTLPTTNIKYLISTAATPIRLTDLLFYPSPYQPGTTLRLGFNLTKAARVKFYVYNHLGILKWHSEKRFDLPGYMLLASENSTPPPTDITLLSELKPLLSPGSYLCIVIAQDDQGNTVKINTKVAVY